MIISKEQQFSEFLPRWNIEDCFVDVLYIDPEKHPNNNKISAVFVKFMNDDSYILPFRHSDCANLDISFLNKLSDSTSMKFCVDKKDIINGIYLKNLIDIKIRLYLESGKILDKSKYQTDAHTHYYNTSPPGNLNGIIPILKHLEAFDNLTKDLKKWTVGTHTPFYNDKVPLALSFVESSGLSVNADKFPGKFKHIDPNGLTYTSYNIYTSTGRPSNAFGGTNYAALGKSDGTRQAFNSRFIDGRLYQFDYDAFHIRLIANLIGYELPKTSAHMWFAEQYFDSPYITNEQYEESKKISFTNLYGQSLNESETIEFFAKTFEFRMKLWEYAQTHGYIPSPISGRKIWLSNIEDVAETKAFNYLLQLLETEHNINIIYELMKYMKPMKSKLILYTYDSFLLDVHPDEIENMKEIKAIVEESGKYPVRIESGITYHSLS